MSKILVSYATKGGDTKEVAEFIADILKADVIEAKNLNENVLNSHDGFVFAASTHGDGQIFANFDDKLGLLNQTDFNGRKVALVGVGNQERHGNDFCSGLSAFLPVLKKAKMIGATDANGYKFNFSRSFINGKFIGLVIDFKGDSDWKSRAEKWAESLNF